MKNKPKSAVRARAPQFVLLLPFLIFGIGVFLYFQTQNEAHVQFARAQEQWRQANYAEAINCYERVYKQYPKSRYADDALWEIGTIYYVNYYDINHALLYFQKVLAEYPESSLLKESCLKLAEIHEVELGDIPQAIKYWRRVLVTDSSLKLRHRVLFKMGNAYFKNNQIKEAFRQFQLLVDDGQDDHLTEQSCIRLGTILQIQKNHAESIEYFQVVLSSTRCGDCRLQAQLGLIESYEFTDELDEAMMTAEAIRTADYPPAMKEELLERLAGKRRYYGMKSWTGR